MFKTIVVGTNFSDTAEVALVKALELARSNHASLHVVTAHDPAPAPVVGGPARPASGPDYHADVALDRLLERAGAADLEVKQHMETAEPGEAILTVADQVGADLIVVGTGGSAPYIRLRRTTPDVLTAAYSARFPTRFPTAPAATC